MSTRARNGRKAVTRITLLTPYSGGNLGDSAIQDAVIANLRFRLPNVQFSGLTLNSDNFVTQHGVSAFPLCCTDRPFYGMSRGIVADQTENSGDFAGRPDQKSLKASLIKAWLKRVLPGSCLKAIRAGWLELFHCIGGYRFLRTQDLLIVSGGGQLDEEWGGPWGHPFALFKWAMLARMARVPCAVVSVGACKLRSKTSRLFISVLLKMSSYRSYRDEKSRKIAAGLLERAARDSVAPDLAFSMPSAELPPVAAMPSKSRNRMVIALSPIAYAKPGNWPHQDRALYDRYLSQMAGVVSQLLQRGYFLVLLYSSLGDDDRVIPEILEHLDDSAKKKLSAQTYIPAIAAWQDVVASLRDADVLIGSRLHSVILSFLAARPTIAVSFDPKVDWVMEDLGQTDYLLNIRGFSTADVIDALDRLLLGKAAAVKKIASYRDRIVPIHELQYDAIAELALKSRNLHN